MNSSTMAAAGVDAVQALARWQHPVASSEALDVLNRAMRPALYRRIRMTIKTGSKFPDFVVIVDSIVAHIHS